jgi:hypothetical protein
MSTTFWDEILWSLVMFTDMLDDPAVSIFMADEVLSPAPVMNFPFSYIHTILLSWLA